METARAEADLAKSGRGESQHSDPGRTTRIIFLELRFHFFGFLWG